MSSVRCQACGLVNFAGLPACRRCGRSLGAPPIADQEPQASHRKKYLKSALRVVTVAAFIIFLWYASLVGTSEPVLFEQRQTLDRAVGILERQGFSTEVLFLKHLVYFRSTDNWWNRKVGHASAFAATNFPFEIVTLYPAFFEQPVDDVERAAILLHEAHHLMGHGEQAAFERTWRERSRLGWVKDRYQGSLVWLNVKESTQYYSPELFTCGQDHHSDCTEVALP